MNIVQTRKEVIKAIESLARLFDMLPMGEVEQVLSEMETLKAEIENEVSKWGEHENPTEVQERRLEQYEGIDSELENAITTLESLKEAIESIESSQADMEGMDLA